MGSQPKAYLPTSKAHINLCVETHVPLHDVYHKFKHINKTKAIAPAKLTGRSTSGTSGGAAVFANLDIATTIFGKGADLGRISDLNGIGDDFAFVHLRLKSVSIAVGCLYLDCEGDPSRKMAQLALFLRSISMPFIIGMDGNMTPSEFEQLGWAAALHGHLHWPEGATHTCTSGQGRVIDWFFISDVLIPIISCVWFNNLAPWTPHKSLMLAILARPRGVLTQQIVKAKSLPTLTKEQLSDITPHHWEEAKHYATEHLAQHTDNRIGSPLQLPNEECQHWEDLHDNTHAWEAGRQYAHWNVAREFLICRAAGIKGSLRCFLLDFLFCF